MQNVISTRDIRTIQSDAYVAKEGLLSRFMSWCNNQEDKRLLWLGIALMGGIATVLPLTLLAVVFFADNNFSLWAITCVVNVPVLIINLAAQSTKIVLPIMFSAWIIDAGIILYCVAIFFLGF